MPRTLFYNRQTISLYIKIIICICMIWWFKHSSVIKLHFRQRCGRHRSLKCSAAEIILQPFTAPRDRCLSVNTSISSLKQIQSPLSSSLKYFNRFATASYSFRLYFIYILKYRFYETHTFKTKTSVSRISTTQMPFLIK